MVDIQSKEVIDKISDELKVQPALEIPRTLAKDIQLTYDVNPPRNVKAFVSGAIVTSGSGTITTSHATKRTFLQSCYLKYQADATADSTTYLLTFTPKGFATTEFIKLTKLSLTATIDGLSIVFPKAIELEPNTTIIVTQTFTVGASTMTGGATTWETDPQ